MDKKRTTKVKVVVRVRPLLNQESVTCVYSSKLNRCVEIFNHRNTDENLQYEFCSVYDGSATQKEIFDESVESLLGHSFNGQNVSIFAYGPTGAGKTHTMVGVASDPGIIPRVMKWIFERISAEKASGDTNAPQTTVTLSYLEIYNEKVRDLMVAESTDLPIREDNKRNIFVTGLTEKVVDSFEAVINLFEPACSNRSVAATNLNEHSSRSHSIVLLKVTRRSHDREYVGKIHLIDLAGSEDNRRTGNKGIRLKESGAINRSLFALGEVVDAINKKTARVPYRNSKLTRLLQDSLGGSCHSLMVTNVAPEEHYYYDTYCTLNFASKSKKITNTNTTNVYSLAPKPTLKRSGSSDTSLLPPGNKLKKQTSCSSLSSSNSSSATSQKSASPWKCSVNERIEELEKKLHQFQDCMTAKEQGKTQCSPPRGQPSPQGKQCRRSTRLSSSTSSSSSPSVVLSQSDSETDNLCRERGGHLKLSLVKVDTDDSPDIVCATPIIKKRKNALKDKSNLFLPGLGKPRHRLQARLKRILDSGPSCSPLFQDFPSSKKKKRKRSRNTDAQDDTPYGKGVADRVSSKLDPTWQEKRNSAFLDLVNTSSSAKELQQLQTVGAKRAKLIYEWRQLHGPFHNVEGLRQIPGISDKYFQQLLKNNLVTH